MGPVDTTASLNVTLEFDDNQRVSVIKNPMFNNQSKSPSFETIENLNKLTIPLKSLPKLYQLKSLNISIQDGEITAIPVYVE